MDKRQESINKLKEAIKNKTLGMYQDGLDKCLYYHKATDSCCAVGLLMDIKDKSQDLKCIEHIESIDKILILSYWKNDTGLTYDELSKLQRLHDRVINNNRIPKYELVTDFENYVNQL